jgi:phosphoribosylanthranilate isomerase
MSKRPSSMWIKICGNTNFEDAQLAASLGADAVGFVFAPSARRVTAAQVAEIAPHLPERVERVGVFPALGADEIVAIVEAAGLNAVQLQGGVSLALVRQLHERFDGQVKLIQTVHWDIDAEGANVEVLSRQLREIAADGMVERVLMDSKVASAIGGTGVSFDWNAARQVFLEASSRVKLIVAGGLRAENVGEALRSLKPWGVDVVSGVEETPGRKSREKMMEFIRVARGTNDRCERVKL